MNEQSSTATHSFGDRLRAHVAIARIDHWVKNVFILPGVVIPLSIQPPHVDNAFLWRIVLSIVSVCLIASSNYVVNEVLDAPHDRLHPIKKNRPVPSGRVNIPIAYVQWIVMMLVGMALAWEVSLPFAAVMAVLWIMGCIYNIPPVRSKDLVYLDVISESVNNPLRLLAGWFMVDSQLTPPISLITAYWMVGCYFMGLKRFSEFREIGNAEVAAAYRTSFKHYTERSLLVSVMFYASAAMLFFGAFIIRYRMELVLSFPLVALVMSIYYSLAFEPHSAVQNPEHLYKQHGLMAAVVACSIVMVALLFIDIPAMYHLFAPTLHK